MAKNCKNHQKYEFRNGSVKIYNGTLPIYFACYTIKPNTESLYRNIKSNLTLGIRP